MIELGLLVGFVIFAAWFISIVTGIFGLILKIAFWILIGFLAGKIIRGKGYGPLGDAALGLGGGIVGNFVFGLLGIGLGGTIGYVISGVVGAILLVYLIRLVTDNKKFAR